MTAVHGNTSLKPLRELAWYSSEDMTATCKGNQLLLDTGLVQVREAIVQYRHLRAYGESIREPEQILPLFWEIAPNNVQEHFVVFCLNGSHVVTTATVLFSGTANHTLAHPREIYQLGVLTGAVGIIVAHNHPSQDLTASRADKDTTQRIKEAGVILGIKLLDHVIVSETEFRSASTEGWL